MRVTVDQVRYIASLARLEFSKEEEATLAEEMSRILDYIDQLSELEISDTEPMSHVLDIHNVFREDKVSPRISHEEALLNAPEADSDYFRVPKVIE